MRKKIVLLLFYFSLFTFHFSFAQSWLWGKGGIGYGFGESAGSDGLGNCYLSGYYYSDDTLSFLDSILINPPHNQNGLSSFLVKYNNSGDIQWVRQSVNYGNINWGNGGTITLDNAGNIYINAAYFDTAIIGSYTFIFPITIGTEDYWVGKYSSDGNLRWATSPTTNSFDSSGVASNSISVDIKGDVFVTGIFSADTVFFGSTLMFGNRHIPLPFLVKYDSIGNILWASAGTGHSFEYNEGDGLGVVNDAKGYTYITGGFSDTIWFGAYQLLSINADDAFLVKYSPDGIIIWAKQTYQPGSNCQNEGNALVSDASGNIYLAGDYLDSVIIGTDTLIAENISPQSQYSFFLTKYDSGGNVLWAKSCEVLDSNEWVVGGLSIDNYKHIYLSVGGGYYNCKVAFGGDTVSLFDTSMYDEASIVFKLDSNGNTLCSSIISGGGGQTNSISSDTSGNYIYFGSTTATVMSFGGDTVTPFTYHNNFPSENLSPFIARWGECGDVVTTVHSPPKEDIGVIVFPNPNNGNFSIQSSVASHQSTVEIYNVFGQQVHPQSNLQNSTFNINLSSQPNGIYLYRVLSENGELVGQGKLIIQK